MQIETETRGADLVVKVLSPRIDAASAIQFKDRMREIGGEGGGRLILDMGAVDFIDSSGLGAIVSVMKMRADGAPLELAALTEKVVKVFRLTRMDSMFTVHDTVPDALAHGRNAA